MLFSYIYQDLKHITQLEKSFLMRLIIIGFGLMFLSWLSMTIQFGNSPTLAPALYYWIGVSLTTPILYYAILPFLRSLYDVKSFRFSIDIPIMGSLLSAYAFSLFVTFISAENRPVFYDSILLILFTLYAARFLQFFCHFRIVKMTQHLQSAPVEQVKVMNSDHEFQLSDIKNIISGDKIQIHPYEYFPVDGIICEGDTSIDESMLTGNTQVISKTIHDTVRAGTCNVEKVITIIATSTFRHSQYGKMLSPGSPQLKQGQIPTDQIALWHQMLILTIVGTIYCWWLPLNQNFAMYCAIASLLITCPCAIAISYPLISARVLEVCAKKGIFITNPIAFFQLSTVNYFLFDKMGTLTEGNLVVDDVKLLNQTPIEKILPILYAVEKTIENQNPIAKAITDYIEQHFPELPSIAIQKMRVFPSQGIRTIVDGKVVLIGQPSWLMKQGVSIAQSKMSPYEKLHHIEYIDIHCAIDGIEVAKLQLLDRIRHHGEDTIHFFSNQHIVSTVISQNALTKQIGSQEKEAFVAHLKDQRYITAMVGNDLGDNPALRRADIGIAMAQGNPFTLLCADIILAEPDLRLIKDCYAFSLQARKILNQCYVIALFFNILMLPLTAVGKLSPLSMLIGLAFSSFMVMANITRLKFR